MIDDTDLFELFGRPRKPAHVWERQFDDFDDKLRELAASDWQEMDRQLLRNYYFDQLAFVKDRQDDLFNYLFPVCLMEWRDSLFRGESICAWGCGTEFHWAMLYGKVLEHLTQPQVAGVNQFVHDSCVSWLEQVPATLWRQEIAGRCHVFFGRINSLAAVFDCAGSVIDHVLRSRSGGRLAIAECFLACLLLDERENPFMEDLARLAPEPIEEGLLFLRWPDSDSFPLGMGSWTTKSHCELTLALQPDRVMADAASVFGKSPDARLQPFAGRRSSEWTSRIELFLDLCKLPPWEDSR